MYCRITCLNSIRELKLFSVFELYDTGNGVQVRRLQLLVSSNLAFSEARQHRAVQDFGSSSRTQSLVEISGGKTR